MQVVRVGKRKLFDKKRRKVFLEWFAATGNCVFSAAKAGVDYRTVWKHRVKDAAFQAAFDIAMEQGSVRAQARLLEDRATGPIDVDGDLDAIALEPPDPVRVLDLVARIEAKRGAPSARRQKGSMPRIASNAEVEKALAKRLAVFARRQRAMGRERCQVRVPDTGSEGAGGGGCQVRVPDTCVPDTCVPDSDVPDEAAGPLHQPTAGHAQVQAAPGSPQPVRGTGDLGIPRPGEEL